MNKNKKVTENPFYKHLEDLEKREKFIHNLRKKILAGLISHMYEAIAHIESVEALIQLENEVESENAQLMLEFALKAIAESSEKKEVSYWKDFLDKIYPLLDSKKVAEMLGISLQALNKKVRKNQIIALKRGGKYLYPQFQFTPEGRIVEGLDKILKILEEKNLSTPLKIEFLISENLRLDGKRPIDLLRAGKIEEVEWAAKSFGEMGV